MGLSPIDGCGDPSMVMIKMDPPVVVKLITTLVHSPIVVVGMCPPVFDKFKIPPMNTGPSMVKAMTPHV